MKKLLVLIIGIVLTGKLFARCASSGILAFPENRQIKQNSWIVLEGFAASQEIINALNQDYPVYLEAEGHKVKLNVKSIHEGMYHLTQALLMPDEKLISGRKYFLKIDNLPSDQESLLSKWNMEDHKLEPIAWNVEAGTDISIPTMVGSPELVNKRTTEYGCGPDVYADFKIQAVDESALLFKTELVNLVNGESSVYYLSSIESSILSVGHDMCSGAFDFSEKGKYKVRFSVMDSCGNTNGEWSVWLEFDSPFEAN